MQPPSAASWRPSLGWLWPFGSTPAVTKESSKPAAQEAPKPANNREKTYTMYEVANHAPELGSWVVIAGNVYDITKFIVEHPGGEDVLLERIGKDVTSQFEDVGHSSEARKRLKELLIGKLATDRLI